MAIALVANIGSSAGSGTTTTSAIDTTGASLLVVNRIGFSGGDLGVVSDNKGNTWVQLPRVTGSGGLWQFFLYCINPIVGTGHTFTITNGTACAIEVAAFSGVTGVLPFDQLSTFIDTAATIQPGSLTPANANSLIVTGVGIYNSGPTVSSIDSGFTITDTNPAGGNFGGSLAYLVQGAAAAVNPTWTFSGSLNLATTMAVFIEGTDVPPATPALIANTTVAVPVTATTGAIDTTGATILVAGVSWFGGGGVGVVTDSKGNVWTPLTAQASGNFNFQFFYAANPTVGSGHTFTLTGGNLGSLQIGAWDGIDSISPFDVENGAGVTTDQGQGGSVTPSSTGSLLLTGFGYENASNIALYGVDRGFKITDSQAAGFNQVGASMAWLAQTATTAENPTWAVLVSANLAICNAVFKKATPGQTIQVPAGSLAITTYAPTPSIFTPTVDIEVPTRAVIITTYVPGTPTDITVPVRALAITTYAPSVGGTRTIEVPVGHLTLATYAPTVFVGSLGVCAERFGPKIYFWEPSYLDRPEDTFLRATDWDAAGYQGLKFVQGLIIEADTEGQTREILLQGDQTDIETITINHDGQLEKPYSLNQPVLRHLLRLLPTDDAFWRLFNVRWVYEPAPEYAREWKTQGTDHDIPGFQFLKDGYIAHASTADITFNVTVDDITFTYTIPHSSGEYVKTYLVFDIKPSGRTTKGTLFTYELTSVNPFQLYQKDCEVRVHDWSGGEYLVKQPFGDISRVYGARI